MKFVRCRSRAPAHKSLSARRVWIEIGLKTVARSGPEASLSARRVWIEIIMVAILSLYALSLSARRVWIEIRSCQASPPLNRCHSLRGECGLKSRPRGYTDNPCRHSLRGECGLKSGYAFLVYSCTIVTLCEESVD